MKHFLEQNGYKAWDSKEDWVGKYQIITNKYQKRVDNTLAWANVPLCECNDKLSINTEVHTITIDGKENTTWTIFMVHQSPVSKEWCDLKIYSIPTEKVVDIEKFESKLRDMWIAFNKD